MSEVRRAPAFFFFCSLSAGLALAGGQLTLTGIAHLSGRPRGYFLDTASGQTFSLAVGESVGGCRLVRLASREGRAWIEFQGVTNEVSFTKEKILAGAGAGLGPRPAAPVVPVIESVRTEIQPPTGDP